MRMRLRGAEVRNFRKLSQLRLENLGDGLTVIAGDNEEGKSTLLQAIRTGFFDKHDMSGERADSLQPYGSKLRPEVRIEFDLEDRSYTLFKAFCSKPEAVLQTPTGSLSGAAAEEELARLLRFERPARAPRQDDNHDHHGLFGMFWVAQGEAYTGLKTSGGGRTSIVQALQTEVGEVLGGERGRRLLGEVEKERALLLTETGKPKGEYAQAGKELERIEQELDVATRERHAYEQRLSDLERVRAQLNRYRREDRREVSAGRLQAAEVAARRLEERKSNLERAGGAVRITGAERELARQQWRQRKDRVAGLESIEQTRAETALRLAQQRRQIAAVGEDFVQRQQAYARVQAAREAADQHVVRVRNSAELVRQGHVKQDLRVTLDKALRARLDATNARGQARAILATDDAVAKLKQLEAAHIHARARLEAAAVRLTFTVQPGAKVELNATPLAAGDGERQLTGATEINVPGQIRFRIEPGADLTDPRRACEDAEIALRRQLSTLACDSVADAEQQATRRRERLQSAAGGDQVIAALAPDGIEALQTRLAQAEAECARLALVAGGDSEPLDLDHAEQDQTRAAQAEREAGKRRDEAALEHGNLRQQESDGLDQLHRESEALDRARNSLTAERETLTDTALETAVTHADLAWANAQASESAARILRDECDPEAVAEELLAATAGHKAIEAEIQRLESESLRLRAELRASGETGWGEKQQDLESQRSAAADVLDARHRRAQALDLLRRALREAEAQARRAFLAPVARRLRPYLQLLFPDSELQLDEHNMEISGLAREGQAETFASLSLGTREQIAVLTRLAFADLVREQGQPALVILDDAIVFTDEARFPAMLRILRKAAQAMQILVLTCKPREFLDAGAPVVHLRDGLTLSARATG